MSNNTIKNSYRILKEENLIVEYHGGVGKIEDAIHFRKIQATDPDFSPEFNVIADLRDLAMDVQVNELKKLVEFYKQTPSIIGNRRNALITENPSQVVLATMLKQMKAGSPQSIKVVSTVGSAVNWVNTGLSGTYVTNILQELKLKAV